MTRGRYDGNTLDGNFSWLGSGVTLDMSDGEKAFHILTDVMSSFVIADLVTLARYLDIDTDTGNEKIDFGSVAVNPDYAFLGTGRLTAPGSFKLPSVTDAGPMTATSGEERDLVYNESDSKVYVCTVTGSPATWAALN